jgi:uncharacterized membrane protein YphA (DoxX/SURF4 family)
MRIAVRIVQIFVGVLFIISGLVKANDPLGLSYKMQEFFELWNSSLQTGNFFAKGLLISLFNFGHEHSLALSILMITLEVAAGLALLLAWKRKAILWLLFLLILFFTFLTGYAYLSGKFTNCGCFGDCLPITPLTSFGKDILLTVLSTFLLWQKNQIEPVFARRFAFAVLAVGTMLTLGLQWYVLTHLPLADCLPFKKGNNIAQQMKPPPGAITDSFAIRFIYEKGGKRFEFSPEELPADFTTYKFIDRTQKLVRKGNAEPAIKGFSLVGESSTDSTEIVLNQPNVLLIFSFELTAEKMNQLKQLAGTADKNGVPVYVATTALQQNKSLAQKAGISNVQFFNCDFTVVRSAARTNPTFYLLQSGTIVKKFSARDADSAMEALTQPPSPPHVSAQVETTTR